MASARPPLPAEVQAPPAARGRKGGRAGTLPGLGRGRKGAGRAKNVRKRLFTRGGAGSLTLPLTSPQSGPGAPRPHPERPLEVTWRGGVQALSSAELPDRPGRRGFGSRDPPAAGKLLPSNPHRLRGVRTPEPSRRPEPGDSQSGGQWREVPRPLHFPVARTWKLSHRQTPSPAPLSGRDPPQTPTPLPRNTLPWPPESGLHPLEPVPESSQPQAGSYLSSWHSW